MTVKPLDAIILLYPSKTQTTKELRESLSEFCKSHNITIFDIINPADKYDYFMMRRLSQIIKYRREPISLVTNKSILNVTLLLTLWSIFEEINEGKSIELVLDFLRGLKESTDKSVCHNAEEFCIVGHKEVRRIADWLSDVLYAIMRDQFIPKSH